MVRIRLVFVEVPHAGKGGTILGQSDPIIRHVQRNAHYDGLDDAPALEFPKD